MNIPTRPGIYLIEDDPDDPHGLPYRTVQVWQGQLALLVSGTRHRVPCRVEQRPDIVWLAEVPTPDACRAVADWAEAVFAWEDAGGRTAPNGGRDVRGADAMLEAGERVIDAFRAARKGREVADG